VNAVKRKPKPAERVSRVITDPDEVAFVCLMMVGRQAEPGEVLELVHVRDQLYQVQSKQVGTGK
jgi:hypothetical protein